MTWYYCGVKEVNELTKGMAVTLSASALARSLDEISASGENVGLYKATYTTLLKSCSFDNRFLETHLLYDIYNEKNGVITSEDVCKITEITDDTVTFQKIDRANEDGGKIISVRFTKEELEKVKMTEVDIGEYYD